MDVEDEMKAREVLLDIGYYRLGFYWAPFEEAYPKLTKRTHRYLPGTKFAYAVRLYYFDFDLRNILLRYISRIEINFRTQVVYHISNAYPDKPLWHLDTSIVRDTLLKSPAYQKAIADIHKERVIRIHAKQHPQEPKPPAWKALEFLPFGVVIHLYENLLNQHLQCDIAKRYGISAQRQFSNYINTVRKLRNSCAHGNVLFDLRLDQAICKGPLGYLHTQKQTLWGACQVVHYLLQTVSANRAAEMRKDIKDALDKVEEPSVRAIIAKQSGIGSTQRFSEEDLGSTHKDLPL